jgi:hypothetical protein
MIGNPVTKTLIRKDGEIKNIVDKRRYNHLLFYQINWVPTNQPDRRVLLNNQLQTILETPWVLQPPDRLLVPASKKPKLKPDEKAPDANDNDLKGPPVNWYHFACYPIKDPKPLKLDLDLYDQFDKEFNNQHEEKLRQVEFTPKWFGVPVSKNKEPIPASKDEDKDPLPGTALPHIVLYEYASQLNFKPAKEAWVRDQFNEKPLPISVTKPSLLGVPTDKVWWSEGK